MSWVATFVIRFFTKLMVDFTVIVQLRHPQELGGLYWILCLVLGQATSFVAVHLHLHSQKYPTAYQNRLWAVVVSVEAVFIVFFAIFVLMMKKEYRASFFSTITAKQFNHNNFRNAASVQAKFSIFTVHPSMYRDIRDEIKQYVAEHYSALIEERPEWFTERVRKTIPEDMIPLEEEGEDERNSSVREVGGARRGSRK